MYAEADYTKGTTAFMWLSSKVTEIAESIYQKREDEIKKSVGPTPKHLV